MANIFLPPGFNKDNPVIKVGNICYQYKQPSGEDPQVVNVDESFQTCEECLAPSGVISPSPILPSPSPVEPSPSPYPCGNCNTYECASSCYQITASGFTGPSCDQLEGVYVVTDEGQFGCYWRNQPNTDPLEAEIYTDVGFFILQLYKGGQSTRWYADFDPDCSVFTPCPENIVGAWYPDDFDNCKVGTSITVVPIDCVSPSPSP